MNWDSREARKQYLLGALSEADQQAFERALLAAPEQVEALELAEQELIDDFLQGTLTPPERARFTGYFLAAPARKQQLLVAQTLAQYAAEQAVDFTMQPAPAGSGGWRWRLASVFGVQHDWRKLALVGTLLVLLGAAWAAWFFAKPGAPAEDLAQRARPTPATVSSATPVVPPAASSPSPALLGEEVIARDIRARVASDPADLLIREQRAAALGLLESKRVYLETSGAPSLRQTISAKLTQRLQAGGKFSFTAQPAEADIALKAVVAALPGERLALTVRLVDAAGKVIWPLTPHTAGRRYEGPMEKVLERLRHDLLNDMQRLAQQQK